MENRNMPVVPLPNPGEGGAVFPGNENTGAIPVIPLPNPGEGGAVNPGGIIQPLPNITITVPVRYAAVRFLNATHGYPAFRILIDGVRAANLLDAGSATGYIRIPAGSRTITVAGQDGYIYLEQALPFAASTTSTVAIINHAGGLTLTKIADACRVV
ncbi:MAG: DUF4397 domain-containing protein [Clostridiales bacterium]|nr:DUF4397 domain-containing protein [Clostridiales bacterium]